jgi:GH18 family chitinase
MMKNKNPGAGFRPLILLSALLVLAGTFLFTGSTGPVVPPEGYRVIGYAPEWVGLTALAARTDFSLFTHVNVAFGNPDYAGRFHPLPGEAGFIHRAHKAGVKVYYSIGGGWFSYVPEGQAVWFRFMSDSRRKEFVEGLVEYVIAAGYDGIDVDLEGDVINADYPAFIMTLYGRLQAVRTRAGEVPGLTAALPGHEIDSDITPAVLACFDWINIMAYDLTGPWDPGTPGPHSPYEYAASSLELFRSRGLGPERLVLGIPLYGYGFGPGCSDEEYPWKKIIAAWPGGFDQDTVSINNRGGVLYYNGMDTIRKKSLLAARESSGIMFWQIDSDVKGDRSLIRCAVETLSSR